MSYKDYYKILGIDRDASATEVEAAYLKLSARYSSAEFIDDEINEVILQNIVEAFMVLSDSDTRLDYDTKGNDWELPDSFYDDMDTFHDETGMVEEHVENEAQPKAEDIANSFKSFFEKGFKEVIRMGQQQSKLQQLHVHVNIPLSINDALLGSTKKITLPDGEEIGVPIPKGAFPGQRLRLAGKGKTNAEDNTTGDLWVTLIEQAHSYFFRKGANILYHASIDVYTAMLGGKITVPTLDGKIKMDIPNGIISNAQLKIQNGGLPLFNSPEERGDFYVELHFEMPRDLSQEEIDLIKELRDMRKK